MFPQVALLAISLLPATIMAAPNTPPPPPAAVAEAATACATSFPEYARVSQAQPVESYLPDFIISQEAGATNKNDMFVEFNIPAGSYGCQLEAYFPPNYPITASGRQDVYVYSVNGPLSRSPRGIDVSWDYSPAPISHVGTIRFESNPTLPTRKVIGSFTCQPTLTYRLSIGRDFTDQGYVSFAQSSTAGLRMTYNC